MNSKILRYTVPPEDDGRLVWRIARGKWAYPRASFRAPK